MYETYQETPSESRSHIRVIVLTLLILMVAAVGAFLLFRSFQKTEEVDQPTASVSAGLVYDDAAVEGGWEHLSQEEIEASLNEKVEAGMINISMNTAPIFADGTSEGNVMIVNETINNYPQMVEIIQNDTQEVIYTSKAIAVGSKIESAKLAVDLEAGTYECTAMFHSLDPDTGAVLGSAGAVITVTIQN